MRQISRYPGIECLFFYIAPAFCLQTAAGTHAIEVTILVEVETVSLGKYTADNVYEHASVKTSGLGVSALGMLPLSQQFVLFGKLGVLAKFTDTEAYATSGSYFYSQKKTSANALLGLGAEYNFTPKLALRAEYEYFGKSSVDDVTAKISNGMFSLGMRYIF